jgi:hypothetical protein
MRPGVPSEQRTVSATGQRLTLRLGVREEGCPAALPWLQEAVPKMSLLNVHSPQPQPYIYRAGPPESQLRGTMDGQGSKGHVGQGSLERALWPPVQRFRAPPSKGRSLDSASPKGCPQPTLVHNTHGPELWSLKACLLGAHGRHCHGRHCPPA